jgi:predicted CoA-binding protein
MNLSETVVILGASDKPERYAYQAMRQLRAQGHRVVLVNPRLDHIEGHPVVHDLADLSVPVDTVTLYVGAAVSSGLEEKLRTLRPGRVIFNPGAENPALAASLREAGIQTEEACTLVLLRTGQF